MQFISCSPRLRIDIREGRTNYTPKGDVVSVDPPLYVQFYPGGASAANFRDLADKLPGLWQGVGRDEDPYETRIGWYDTVTAQEELGWSDEDRELVEAKLLRVGDPNVILVEEPKVETPYGRYDQHRKTAGRRTLEHVIADITQTFELAGFDIEQAVAYERQNLNDQKVIDALYGLAGDNADPAEVEEVIAA